MHKKRMLRILLSTFLAGVLLLVIAVAAFLQWLRW